VAFKYNAGNPRKDMPVGLPFKLTDYIELVEWTGKKMRSDTYGNKRGTIDENLPPILQQVKDNHSGDATLVAQIK